MSAPETFQIPIEVAETYESRFVPALFADWAPHVVEMGDVAPGQSVLDVAALPFEAAAFDVVLCQMALMFFADREAAVREMRRVVTPEGTVVIMVPSSLDAQPAYRLLVELAASHAGPEAVAMLSAYWTCGDLDELLATVRTAGLDVLSTRTRMGTARFASIDEFVAVEVESTPVRERLTDDEYEMLRREANTVLAGFTSAEGTAEIPIEGHLVAGRPR